MMVPEIFDLSKMKKALPELPWQRRDKYMKFGIKAEDAESYVGDRELGNFLKKSLRIFPVIRN